MITPFPSSGYFGGTAADYLEIPANGTLKSLEIMIRDTDPEFLNLRGIEFYNGSEKLNIDKKNVNVSQSSFRDSDQTRDPYTLLTKKGCHSALQQNPSWKISLPAGINITSIRLYNRTDGWGIRSRDIICTLEFNEGRKQIHEVNDPENVISVLANLISEIESPAEHQVNDNGTPFTVNISSILKHLEHHNKVLTREESNALAALIPTNKGSVWGDDEFKLAARILVDQKRRLRDASTGIRSFAFALNTRSKLDRLQLEMDGITSNLRQDQLRISRHGIYDSGLLRKNISAHLASLRRAMLLLQDHGYMSVLCYGTLLGAVREQKFIFHDDDVDIAVVLNDGVANNVQKSMNNIAEIFKSDGYGLNTLSDKHHNIHVRDTSNGGVLDIFPVQIVGDEAFLHMEKMNWRSVSAQWFENIKLVELHDQLFPAPGNAESLLAERYGETWKVPDPYYEWTWPLANK